MRNQVFKKLFSVLLALIMAAGLLPASVLAEGEGNADSTPAPTETVQPTESAEPTAPTETETPEEPAADPTEEITIAPVNEVAAQAVRDTSKDPFYRIVHLDCGRKYFSVENIKKLIDEMVKCKYNQLELAFGNDGFRFILNDMRLSYSDGNGNEVEKSHEDVVNALKKGNMAYTGINEIDDEANKYLTEADMTAILDYAKGKVDIVPLLNMPGHAKAMISQFSGYYTGDFSVNLSNTEAKNYALAMLQKYVDWFKGKVNFFSFGADEYNNYSHDCNTVDGFVAECTNIIIKAGMTPRAFNDSVCYNNSKNCGANIDRALQICHWAQGWGGYETSKASTIKNAGFSLINTNGSWYYVLKPYTYEENGQTKYNDDQSKYLCNVGANYAIELPTLKCASNYPTVDTYVTLNVTQKGSETVTGGKGVMFCIWCDKYDALTDSEVISNADYGALKQISALANQYWREDITTDPETTPTPTPTPDQTKDVTVEVELVVGDETNGSKTFDVVGEMTTESDGDIAKAAVAQGAAVQSSVKEVTQITSGKSYLIYNNRYGAVLTTNKSTAWGGDTDGLELNGAATIDNVSKLNTWVITGADGSYTVKSEKGYMTIGNNTSGYATSETKISLVYTDNGYWNISYNGYYLNNLGGEAQAGGWANDRAPGDAGSKWTIYEIVEESAGSTTLTITATGEGETNVKVGNTTYNIHVTAPEKTETIQLAHDGTYFLPEGAENVKASGSAVTVSGTTVTAGKDDGTATVTFETKNEGGKITAKYTYTFNVSAIDWSNAPSLPVQLWVTNMPVGRPNQKIDGTDENGLKIVMNGTATACTPATPKMSAEYAHKEEGVLLREYLLQGNVVGEYGISYNQLGNVNMTDGEPTQYKFWKGVVLHNGDIQNHQNGESDDKSDKSMSGSNIEKVRYWANSEGNLTWQYLEGNEWKDFVDINEASSEGKDTLIAYYLQKFVITDEITTLTRDYGAQPSSSMTETGGNIWNSKYTATCFAVVYPGNVLSRSEEKIYEAAMMRGLNPSTDYDKLGNGKQSVGVVYAENTSDRIVSKITVVKAKSVNLTNSAWPVGDGTNNPIEWQKKTLDSGAEWYDERIVWSKDNPELYGTAPYFVGAKFDSNGEPDLENSVYFTEDMQAYLILVYLEDVQKEDSLEYVYWDDNAQKAINPKKYFINVNADVTFISGLKQGENVIGGTKQWLGKQGEAGYLPDDAYIVNSGNGKIEFNKDITIIDGVAANYRSGIYEYVGADISEDGKTLTLHYNLKQVADKTFVVDFGLPIEIPFTEFGINQVSNNNIISFTANGQINLEREGEYGHGKIVIDKKVVIYTLTATIDNKIAIPVYMYDEDREVIKDGDKPKAFTVYVIPATNVYYEDSFAKFDNGSYNGGAIEWEDAGTKPQDTPTQALEALGEKKNVYGRDTAYDNCTMFSMGSAHKVTVTNDMAKDGVVWPTAQFTFKGTGFDIISLTDNTSGAIYVSVYPGDKAEGTPKKYVVNNYYGYDYVNGKWVVKMDAGNNALYQIPVIKIKDLDYGTHTVVIKVAYSAFQDVADKKQYSFWLDAVRVYDPMGANNSDTYAPDGEAKPVFVEVRDMLLSASSVAENNTNNGAVFIDGNGSAAIATDYKNFGPNHEVYLANNQAIAFTIVDAAKYADIQIGIKSTGNSAVKYKINNGTEATIGTATDMYYSIKDYASNGDVVTITNTGEAVLSITNIKCTMGTSSAKTDTVDLVMSAEDVAVAISMVNSAITPVEPEPEPEPEKTFEPDRFEASWSRNVMQGRKATLTVKTSEDVEAITVDGQTIRSYRTRTERVGFGRYAKRVTYREFTYSMVAQGTADFSVTAINAEGTESEAITARLTVETRPNSMRDMWDWFKGWF